MHSEHRRQRKNWRAAAPLAWMRTKKPILMRWGYPHVMDRYRFHLTLTGATDSEERDALERALAPLTAPLCEPPLAIAKIALFEEETPGAPI